MADETQVEVEAVAEAAAKAPAKVAGTIADTIETIVEKSANVGKRTRATAVRKAKRAAAANEAAVKIATKAATRRTARKTRKVAAKTRKVAAKTGAATKERIQKVTKTVYNGFEAVPAFAPFQTLLNEANERGQDFVKRGQKVAEELADLARANVEAVVEAGRVASEGARSIGQDVVAKQRDSFEQAADAIRSLAEAKSPTEYLQLQGDFARASFDRAVAETSKLTESLVKLAGEAFQPLSNRASANAERFNTLVA
jgi:phasin family protein